VLTGGRPGRTDTQLENIIPPPHPSMTGGSTKIAFGGQSSRTHPKLRFCFGKFCDLIFIVLLRSLY